MQLQETWIEVAADLQKYLWISHHSDNRSIRFWHSAEHFFCAYAFIHSSSLGNIPVSPTIPSTLTSLCVN